MGRLQRFLSRPVPVVNEFRSLHCRLFSPPVHLRSQSLLGTLLWRQRQTEVGDLSLAGDIFALWVLRIRQVQCFAMLAAVDLRVRTESLLHITAFAFHNVFAVIPALQVAAAEFTFHVVFIAGALIRFLDFQFVVRQLWKVCALTRSRSSSCRQGSCPRLKCPRLKSAAIAARDSF